MIERAALVVIVDDDVSIQRALQRLFRLSGYKVRTFSSAEGLLKLLPVDMPRCVVLDLTLPGMTGIELLARFAQLDNPPPVVVFTGRDEQYLKDRCLALGAIGYFRKPFDKEALLDAVRQIVPPTPSGRSTPRIAIVALLLPSLQYPEPIGELLEVCLALI